MSIKANSNNSLAILYPEIAKEWHPFKNLYLTPDNVTSKSGKKVWWKCSFGHEWEAVISNRTRLGSSCPYCKGKKAIIGKNDLQTINPMLAREWHPVKNGTLNPTNMMSTSKRKIWWICKEGHEWEATIDSRSKGHGCPYCSGRYAVIGVNDLLTLRPDIAKLWHPTKNNNITPDVVTVSSGTKHWWLGECGHEWQTRVSHMCSKNSLEICPICNGQKRTSFPEQAIYYYAKTIFEDAISRYGAHKKELDIYIPSLQIGIEYDGLLYHTDKTIKKELEKNRFFQEREINIFRIKERVEVETILEGQTVFYRPWDKYKRLNFAIELLFNAIAIKCEINLPELDIDIERDNSKILNLFVKKRKSNGFAAKHTNLLKEWHPSKNGNLNPWYIAEKSNHKFWWMCEKGHEWFVSLNDRVCKKTGCPICSKLKQVETYRKNLVSRRGALSETNPDIASEWCEEKNNPLTPYNVTAGSNKKVYWKCKVCGYEWEAIISNRTRKNQGCPLCYTKRNKK